MQHGIWYNILTRFTTKQNDNRWIIPFFYILTHHTYERKRKIASNLTFLGGCFAAASI